MYVARISHNISASEFINSFGRAIYQPYFGQQPYFQESSFEQSPVNFQKPSVSQKPIQFDEADFGQKPIASRELDCGCPDAEEPKEKWESDNNIYGNACDNILCGTEGKDMIDGGAGDDILYGFGGHDNLFGGEGNDILVGGIGAGDYLSGGVGDDTYVFSGNFGHDVVADKGAKSDFDVIKFTDLNINDVTFSLKGSNLIITDNTKAGNFVEVVNYLNDSANSIEQFDFKDGSATVDVVYNSNGSCDISVSYVPQLNFYC